MTTLNLEAASAARIIDASPAVGLRLPSDNQGAPESATRTLVYTPDLTAAEQATFDRLLAVARSHVAGISPAEWQALEPDIAGLRTYLGTATPTAAQTTSATKAIIRVLRALLRDG
jgi:hypothetical protein